MVVNAYGVEYAKTFGIEEAVYISYLYNKCATDGLSDFSQHFTISRKALYEATGLNDERQAEVEKKLVDFGVLTIYRDKPTECKVQVIFNEKELRGMVVTYLKTDTPPKPKPKPKSASEKATEKKVAIINALKRVFDGENEALKSVLCDWVDTIMYAPNGYLSKQGIELSLQDLHKYSSDVNTLVDVVKIAIKASYKDLAWAIRSHQQNSQRRTSNLHDRNFVDYATIQSTTIDTGNGAF